ncbi:MAG: hypothetical protein ACNA7J_10955 [Wenzhouxiangella sp.]
MIAPSDDNPHGCVHDLRTLGAPLEMLHNGWNQVLAFRNFKAPILIPLVFWLGSLFCLFGGLAVIFSLETGGPMLATPGFWGALALITLGPAILRILGEFIDVTLRIHDHLVLVARRD